MRARSRHSASNYLFAAFLELVIMALFVVIAQPKLRESLFGLFEPPATQAAPASAPRSGNEDRPAFSAFPAGQVDGQHVNRAYRVDPDNANLVFAQPPGTVGAMPSSSGPNLPANTAGQNGGWSMATAPFEQFESFAVSSSGSALAASPASTPVAGSGQMRVATYAPAVGPTQLDVIDWNIASAAQSPRPQVGPSGLPLSGWTASRPAEAEYRGTYPPPYGTQSQWK